MKGMLIIVIRVFNGNLNNFELMIFKLVILLFDMLFGINIVFNLYVVINVLIIIIKVFEVIFSLLGLFLIIFFM